MGAIEIIDCETFVKNLISYQICNCTTNGQERFKVTVYLGMEHVWTKL